MLLHMVREQWTPEYFADPREMSYATLPAIAFPNMDRSKVCGPSIFMTRVKLIRCATASLYGQC